VPRESDSRVFSRDLNRATSEFACDVPHELARVGDAGREEGREGGWEDDPPKEARP